MDNANIPITNMNVSFYDEKLQLKDVLYKIGFRSGNIRFLTIVEICGLA